MCQTCYDRGYHDYPKWVGSAPHPKDYERGFKDHQIEVGESGHYAEETDFCETCYNRGYEDAIKDYWAPPTTPKYGHKESYEKGFDKVKKERQDKERQRQEKEEMTERNREQQRVREQSRREHEENMQHEGRTGLGSFWRRIPSISDNEDWNVMFKLGVIAFIIGGIILLIVFALMFALLNIATIALIAGLANERRRKYLYPVAVCAAMFISIYYIYGIMHTDVAITDSISKNVVPIFIYLNIVSGLIAAYFLIRNYMNSKYPSVEGEREFTKRNLKTMGSLFLVGSLMIWGLIYFESKHFAQLDTQKIDPLNQVQNELASKSDSPSDVQFTLKGTYNNKDNDNVVNIRESPNGKILKTIPFGEIFYYTPTNNQWYKVKTIDGVVGFIKADRIQPVEESIDEKQLAGTVQTKQGSNLRLRSEPSEQSPVIASIPNGTTVAILGYSDHFEEVAGEKGKWCNISFNGKVGWAWGGFIKNNDVEKGVQDTNSKDEGDKFLGAWIGEDPNCKNSSLKVFITKKGNRYLIEFSYASDCADFDGYNCLSSYSDNQLLGFQKDYNSQVKVDYINSNKISIPLLAQDRILYLHR